MNKKRMSDGWLMGIIAVLFIGLFIAIMTFSLQVPPPAFHRAIDTRFAYLQRTIEQEDVLKAIESARVPNQKLTPAEIDILDTEWRQERGVNARMRELMTNSIAKKLRGLQKQHPEFVEIFVTCENGLNLAQTNKTSDYYQADEEWWTRTYQAGGRYKWTGPIEFDDSAGAWSVPLYMTILNNEGNVVGVAKALLDVNTLR